jgi:hypothetical protein
MNNLKHLLLAVSMMVIIACYQKSDMAGRSLNEIAEEYVRTGLFIGQYDPDFVDAYYGPDYLKPQHKPSEFPKDSILHTIDSLQKELNKIATGTTDSSARAKWMAGQLTAFSRRVKIITGQTASFDEESKDLFGVKAPEYSAKHYQQLIDSLDRILPGGGTVQGRFQALANRFVIPKGKLDTVFKATIAEARKRTLAHYKLPTEEQFTLTYVTDKPWSGYNWYKGRYTSQIQINTDIEIFIERAIDVGSHESYPGHHMYNMLLEKNLYRDKGWVEISLYPLFSPQSFIAEGSANYGIELVFPGDEKIRFSKDIILPLADLDTAGIDLYFKALAIRGKLNYARNEAARGLVNGTMSEKEALNWLMKYCLYNEETALKSIGFVKKYRSYVINYNYGQDAVRRYISKGKAGQQWELFSTLLSTPVNTDELMK